MTEVGRNEMERSWEWDAALVQPPPLQLLRRGMIDLEDVHVACEGRLPQREAVKAGANDDVLTHTAPNCDGQEILGVSRAENSPTVTGMKLQRASSTICGSPSFSHRSRACGLRLLRTTLRTASRSASRTSLSPRIINQRRWAQATVDSTHQGRSECSEARTRLLHVTLRVGPAL